MVLYSRPEILQRLREVISFHRPIVGAGAGIGLSAKFLEAGSADLIIVYNSGRYRMAGLGSHAGLLPYGDANAIVVDTAREILPIFLKQIKELGFSGIQNFPTVGLIDGNFRANLEETGMGYELEIEMIRIASEMGLVTSPYIFNVEEAVSMAKASADIIVAHMGLTTNAVINVREDIIVLCHGGPIVEFKDAEYVLSRTKGVHRFYGASSMERIPVEVAITNNTKKLKEIHIAD
ncbi:Pyruvate/Phosphoenolpyruvate kinase-like domain-containing protein [Daldinia decipiens]|uniref:Pyruvate/Phosphoenolpyruvate kinase-like domain-containing protein n=1 Tax=Daldinia decipiens TaxID=326647 RepID=UPI0020C43624|nr:Pyruvate/Phosphoenolpyruvate kinase-like domain-containing protein [Daldinia decipiens]KAI1652998.1 Pyruvate/Phosphoenolpyruvate kinase-like domain-containing protein [Daldinia decipiens]